MDKTICLLNDSFPPQIDGVANTVVNYARVIDEKGGRPIVLAPDYPDKYDDRFNYPVIRYPSLDMRKQLGYMAGMPFSPKIMETLAGEDVSLIHSHCPAASLLMARSLRKQLDAPIILTYHTKFDEDIYKAIKGKLLPEGLIKVMVENISASDEVWVVSEGAGENLRSLGYKGDYVVMTNGVDMPFGRVSDKEVEEAVAAYKLPADVPVFLFVGRMMWYKGQKLILDALEGLHSQNIDFRMVFIGSGADAQDICEYAEQLGLGGKCIFTGAIRDRNLIRAWYCRADLFLFPSTYDTNGLVVREAAACSLGSVLIGNSCASEGVTNGHNGFIMTQTAASLAALLTKLCANRPLMKQVGENAGRELYVSWDMAVEKALERYEIVIDNYKSGKYRKHHSMTDELLKASGEMMDVMAQIGSFKPFAGLTEGPIIDSALGVSPIDMEDDE